MYAVRKTVGGTAELMYYADGNDALEVVMML
jgi:hypothetical protein